jgi:hypothetical protein
LKASKTKAPFVLPHFTRPINGFLLSDGFTACVLKAFIGLLANNTAQINADNLFMLFAKGSPVNL